MDEKNIQRIILKEDDILLVKVPNEIFSRRDAVLKIHASLRNRLHPRKNKILILPESIQISVIGESEIKEYITNVDLWQLWDEKGNEVDEI